MGFHQKNFIVLVCDGPLFSIRIGEMPNNKPPSRIHPAPRVPRPRSHRLLRFCPPGDYAFSLLDGTRYKRFAAVNRTEETRMPKAPGSRFASNTAYGAPQGVGPKSFRETP